MRAVSLNAAFKTGLTPPDGTAFEDSNFSQIEPFTEPFVSGAGLKFSNCNLTNCLLPADAVVTRGKRPGNVTLAVDGKQYTSRQRTYTSEIHNVETEPGVWADQVVIVERRIVGTPESWVEGAVIRETRKGDQVE